MLMTVPHLDNEHLLKHCRRPSHLTFLYGKHVRVWVSNRFGWEHDWATNLPDVHWKKWQQLLVSTKRAPSFVAVHLFLPRREANQRGQSFAFERKQWSAILYIEHWPHDHSFVVPGCIVIVLDSRRPDPCHDNNRGRSSNRTDQVHAMTDWEDKRSKVYRHWTREEAVVLRWECKKTGTSCHEASKEPPMLLRQVPPVDFSLDLIDWRERWSSVSRWKTTYSRIGRAKHTFSLLVTRRDSWYMFSAGAHLEQFF